MAKKSIWDDDSTPYGTYEGEAGNPAQWAKTFSSVWEQSDSVKAILGESAYTILGVQPSITDYSLRMRFRELVKKYHPDKSQTSAIMFREVIKAYRTIKTMRATKNNVFIQSPSTSPATATAQSSSSDSILVVPQLLTPIVETEVESYLDNPEYGIQEKKDGKHITLQILDNELIVRNKKGIGCGCSPDFESSIRFVGKDILIDGEQIGSTFWVWDCLEYEGLDQRMFPYIARYKKLKTINFGDAIKILDLATSWNAKRNMFKKIKRDGREGVVFKKLTGAYFPGRNMEQLKFKFYATASVIVVEGRPGRASIGMELYNEHGEREFVGYCSCNRNPPIGSIAEIKYLYAYRGGSLYQPSFKELRDDVDSEECITSQLKYKFEES